ncbi:MAG: hypothetical protein ING75_09160 [Rhodocyclaceae bacterium]|nr:hypothetical protein [Rhodocyclaceae bacterium]
MASLIILVLCIGAICYPIVWIIGLFKGFPVGDAWQDETAEERGRRVDLQIQQEQGANGQDVFGQSLHDGGHRDHHH